MTRRQRRSRFGATAVLAGLVLLGSYPVETAPPFSDWSAAANLGAAVNSEFEEALAHVSKDGLSLYFASDRPGIGDFDVWVSQRQSRHDAWGLPMNLGPNINTTFNDRAPALSRDGHFLFFATNRPGSFGLLDIWVSYRTDTHDDFSWGSPMNLGAGVNGSANDYGPGFLENDDIGIPSLLFGSNRPGGAGGFDVYISNLQANGSFGPGSLITELSSPDADFRPTVRPNGLELFFDSARPGPTGIAGIGLRDLWASTRRTVSAPWSTPVHMGPVVNSEFDDIFPALTSDGTTLIFSSDRPGGLGGLDLYVSSRDKRD
jgi:Tol biopolymer transport system component